MQGFEPHDVYCHRHKIEGPLTGIYVYAVIYTHYMTLVDHHLYNGGVLS